MSQTSVKRNALEKKNSKSASLIVYYDETYATWWISRSMSKEIVAFLQKKGFAIKNAAELRAFMESSIKENTAYKSVVVFSQDIIPDTICQSPSPSTIVRAFLDLGGTIVWIGDNPFYYQGIAMSKSTSTLSSDKQQLQFGSILLDKEGRYTRLWGLNGPYGVLGVVPVFMSSPSTKVKITRKGRNVFGLQNTWYSNRPIIAKGVALTMRLKTKLKILGSCKPIYPISTRKILMQRKEEEDTSLFSIMHYFSALIGFIPAIITAATALYVFLTSTNALLLEVLIATATSLGILYPAFWFLKLREKFASAWLKNFSDSYPNSGFMRIWDFEPYEITEIMRQDLYAVATHFSIGLSEQ